jgi:L-threonylcarbamoyladenylate synthase
MKHVRVDPGDPDLQVIGDAARVIAANGIVAYPTDTLYGLAVNPRSPVAIERLFALKDRPSDRAIPLIADSRASARAAVEWTPEADRLADRCWPGPLTLVLRATSGLAPALLGADATVAVRVPDSAVARALAAASSGLITATSANTSGNPATADPAELLPLAGRGLDLLLDAGLSPGGPPSTIVDLTARAPRLVRAGAVGWERVLEFLGLRPPP